MKKIFIVTAWRTFFISKEMTDLTQFSELHAGLGNKVLIVAH